ncbi:MAG: hypothetical protein AAGD01_03300 [Acidobacteriota bacterium]
MSLTQLSGPIAFDSAQVIGVNAVRTTEIPGTTDRVHSFDIFLQGTTLGFGSDNEADAQKAHAEVKALVGESFSGGGISVNKGAVLGLGTIAEVSGVEGDVHDFTFAILVDGGNLNPRFDSLADAQNFWNEIAGNAA